VLFNNTEIKSYSIKEALGEQASYGEIRAVIAHLNSKKDKEHYK